MTELEELTGDLDVTIPLHDVSKYAAGDQPASWLIIQGRPKSLRPDGWIYVRTDTQIVGRVRARRVGHLDVRPERTGSPPGVRGAGPVVFVDPATWDTSRRWDLSSDRRFYGQGTRYVRTAEDLALHHWSAAEGAHYGGPIHPTRATDLGDPGAVENHHSTTGDEAGADGWMVEGAVKLTQVVSYERNRKARERCIREYGARCSACEMSFEERYGALGDGFIHVHHLREISSVGAEYMVDPVQDLRPLCPNCHAMVHRRSPALSIEELRRILLEQHG